MGHRRGMLGEALGSAEADGELEHFEPVEHGEGFLFPALHLEGEGRAGALALALEHLAVGVVCGQRAQIPDRRRPRGGRRESPPPCARPRPRRSSGASGFRASASAASRYGDRTSCRGWCACRGSARAPPPFPSSRRRSGRNGRRHIWSARSPPDRRRGRAASGAGVRTSYCRR